MPSCVVRTCRNAGKGLVTFHVIPKDLSVRRQWLENVQRMDLFCSKHGDLVCPPFYHRNVVVR